MEEIYRTREDVEIIVVATRVKCPYCGTEWLEENKDESGHTYVIECSGDYPHESCGKEFEMHFD